MNQPTRLGILLPGMLFFCALPALRAELRFQPDQIDLGSLSEDEHTIGVWLCNDGMEDVQPENPLVLGDRLTPPQNLPVIPAGDSLLLEIELDLHQDLQLREAILVPQPGQGSWAILETRAEPFHEDWPGATNLWGEDLIDYLAAEVDNHTVFSYSGAREQMFGNYDNENGQVQCVYTGEWLSTSGIPDHTVMNTEHTWPQSMGAEGDARSDMHHLFPTMSTSNSVRGNLPFGVVQTSNWSSGGSLRGTDAGGVSVFEPRDVHKGDCARSMFYFALRYGNLSSFLSYQEEVLRDWAFSDPVSQKERDRNNAIDGLQHNRNPFVDHNDYLERISGLAGDPDPVWARLLDLPEGSLDLGQVEESDTLRFIIPVLNPGNQSLLFGYVQAIDTEQLSVSSHPTQLPSMELGQVELAFHPLEAGEFSTQLRFSSNAQNGTLQNLAVQATVLPSSGLEENPGTRPQLMSLGTPYPNPFNPSTMIPFQLGASSVVSLGIYDLQGRLQVRLIDEEARAAGVHRLRFDGTGLPGGMYMVLLEGVSGRAAQKLLLVK